MKYGERAMTLKVSQQRSNGMYSRILGHRRGMPRPWAIRWYWLPYRRMLSTAKAYMCIRDTMVRSGGWLPIEGEKLWAGGAVLISPWPSHPYDLECRRATILNVYVYPQFRRQGIAHCLMQSIIGWCQQQGFAAVYLHASGDGRPLYENLGFEPTTEMRLKLKASV